MLQVQISLIRQGGKTLLFRKMKRAWRIPHELFLSILAVPIVVVIRLIRPWLLVRWDNMPSPRIGHFAANPELYLCERDAGINVPRQRHKDVFFMEQPICNQQLAKMWKRVLRVWPHWIMSVIRRVNLLIPGGRIHQICDDSHSDRDVHNLLDRFSPHLEFTAEEEARGAAELMMMGIPKGAPFVCLIVRDAAYLDDHQPKDWSYHNYRDTDIQNYVLAAEEIADRGYFVLRMGAKVRDSINSSHLRVIDYAVNGMRSDFMDIYLGSKCAFCISTSTGLDAVPLIFRRPIVFVNMVPLGYLWTFGSKIIGITRHHFAVQKNRELTLKEIFTHGVGFSLRTSDYQLKGIQLIENTPEEILEVVVEMAERLQGTWQPELNDDKLQSQFWEIFTADAYSLPLHGEIHGRFGSHFLRANGDFLE